MIIPFRIFTMIQITPNIRIPEREIVLRFVRSSGPGGQNVNKVATAVQLRFDVARSPSLADDVRARLVRLAGRRVTADGILIIEADRFRTQERNREDAVMRLVELIRLAAQRPKPRKKTKPSKAAKEKRIEQKKRRSGIKKLRTSRPEPE